MPASQLATTHGFDEKDAHRVGFVRVAHVCLRSSASPAQLDVGDLEFIPANQWYGSLKSITTVRRSHLGSCIDHDTGVRN